MNSQFHWFTRTFLSLSKPSDRGRLLRDKNVYSSHAKVNLTFPFGNKIQNIQIMGSVNPSQPQQTVQKFKSEQLQAITNEFCLQKQQIHQLYSCFTSLQSQRQAYLTLDDLAQTLHQGQLHFSELPYLQRLFNIISKKSSGKLFFEQYVVGISTFCLMSREAVLNFVFDWLDQDGDGQIDREDIARAVEYSNPRTVRKTFLCNFMIQLDCNLKDDQLWDFQAFRKRQSQLLFLIWPAYELQQNLRQKNMGIDFWEKQYLKIEKAEQQLRNNQKRSDKINDKITKLTAKKRRTDHEVTLKQIMTIRQPRVALTDLHLLESRTIQRRKSCPYIKPVFLSPSVELEDESSSALSPQDKIRQ